jgi:hypothetical protein
MGSRSSAMRRIFFMTLLYGIAAGAGDNPWAIRRGLRR